MQELPLASPCVVAGAAAHNRHRLLLRCWGAACRMNPTGEPHRMPPLLSQQRPLMQHAQRMTLRSKRRRENRSLPTYREP